MMTNAANNKAVRIAFDSLTLRAVCAELRGQLIGGVVQDVRQPEPLEVRLAIRSSGRNFVLLLSADASFARVHLTDAIGANSPTPPAFCAAMRRHVQGGIITSIQQSDFDRVCTLTVEKRDDSDGIIPTSLTAEIMGKHSNLILINRDGIVVEAAKRISRRINRIRETLPGVRYVAPPRPQSKRDPLSPLALDHLLEHAPQDVADLHAWLTANYLGISPFLATELVARVAGEQPAGALVDSGQPPVRQRWLASLRMAWTELFGAADEDDYAPVRISLPSNRQAVYPFPSVQFPRSVQQRIPSLNDGLDQVYVNEIAHQRFDVSVADLRARLDREAKRVGKQKQSIERTIAEGFRSEEYRRSGELLLANLHRMEPGMAGVTVSDYYDPNGADREIPLDPKLTPHDNANAYFRRFQKTRDGLARAEERLAQTEEDEKRLTSAQARLAAIAANGPSHLEAVEQLRSTLRSEGILRENEADREEAGETRPDFAGHKISRVTTPEGFEIFIGETATANDYLTTRVAASNDIWLHVRSSTSAHVVIRTNGKPENVPRSVLEHAAVLCARHSGQKHSSLVPVDYTLKRYVRKPRKAAPGSVTIQQEKTLHVTP